MFLLEGVSDTSVVRSLARLASPGVKMQDIKHLDIQTIHICWM